MGFSEGKRLTKPDRELQHEGIQAEQIGLHLIAVAKLPAQSGHDGR